MGNSDRTYGKAIVTRVILLAVAAALMTGLGAVPAAGSQTDTGLRGKVLRGPISPVCRSDVPCYVPFKGTLVFTRVVSLSGAPAKRAQTAADGTYRVLLAPGRYRVKTPSRPLPSKFGGGVDPAVVVVARAGIRRLNFVVDTGIR